MHLQTLGRLDLQQGLVGGGEGVLPDLFPMVAAMVTAVIKNKKSLGGQGEA